MKGGIFSRGRVVEGTPLPTDLGWILTAMSLRCVLTMVPAWLSLLCLYFPQVSWALLSSFRSWLWGLTTLSPTPPGLVTLTMDGSSWGRGSKLAIGLLWDHEVKGPRVNRPWYGQAEGRGRNFPPCQVPSSHGRKIEPGDKVRTLLQAFPEAQPTELYVEVPENYGGNYPLYLTKVSLCARWVAFSPSSVSSAFSISFYCLAQV